jgi:wyosine [tRNA(Phe)-imidazoG37] synthetase (radical SAM superfamily)
MELELGAAPLLANECSGMSEACSLAAANYSGPVAESTIEIKNSYAAVKDHTRIYHDFTYVYPVISRRSYGLSVGINLNPDKVCNFDCLYCEVDRKTPGKVSKLDLDQMRDELVAMIRFARDGGLAKEPKFDELPPFLSRNIKDIAFSGDGEPTMVANFDECVSMVADVKKTEGLDRTLIRLITDAAGLDTAAVRRGLATMDTNNGEIWAKLDAGTEEYYRTVNRTRVGFDRVLNNLLETAKLRSIVIQSLFLKLHDQPMPTEELQAYCDRLSHIVAAGGRIHEVHLYTIARPTPVDFAGRLSKEELEYMAGVVRENTGLTVLTFD